MNHLRRFCSFSSIKLAFRSSSQTQKCSQISKTISLQKRQISISSSLHKTNPTFEETRELSGIENEPDLDQHSSSEKLNEDLFWDRVRHSLEQNDHYEQKYKSASGIARHVFVLQLKMQHRSKSRQSTSADLQLAESISLVQTLSSWRVIDSHIIGSKNSASREIFGSGNQEMLAKRIAESGANVLFVVMDKLTSSQVKSLRRTLLGNSHEIHIYDRYKIVLEIFKRNARSSVAKLQIALAEIPYIRHRYENNDLYKSVERKIRKELDAKLRTRSMLNSQRHEKKLPVVSVFGYTNVGKTSFIKGA
jgi:hypothetical protein